MRITPRLGTGSHKSRDVCVVCTHAGPYLIVRAFEELAGMIQRLGGEKEGRLEEELDLNRSGVLDPPCSIHDSDNDSI